MSVFDDIYRENRWNGIESRSGPGSGPVATMHLSEFLPKWCAENGIESVLDVGCGDGYWMPDLPGYVGMDVSLEAIRRAQGRHPTRPYMVADLTGGAWAASRQFDAVFTRDAMQHLSLRDGQLMLVNLLALASRFLMASTYRVPHNVDIVTGNAYSPNLEIEPFGLGPPMAYVPDGLSYHDPTLVRDETKFLGIWRLDGG
jgi:SAM-dependent methyltransferase